MLAAVTYLWHLYLAYEDYTTEALKACQYK